MNYNKISGFSDEITEITKEQFEELNKLGITYYEPRGIDGENISKLTETQMYELKVLMEQYGIKASSIGSPIGKIKVSDDFESHLEVLKNVVQAAKILDTKYIRVFSFYHETGTEWTQEEREEVFRRIKIMVDYAKEHNVILLHENEKDIYGDTADRCLELMKEFYGPNFKAIFDPANFVQCKEDTMRAYELLKPYIAYMHIKDALLEDDSIVPAGYGDANVEFILSNLFGAGYEGFLSLEPHLADFKGFADLEIDANTKLMNKSCDGKQAFKLAYDALLAILDKI